VEHRGRPEIRRENLKSSANWRSPPMRHMTQICVTFAPEIGGFAAESGGFEVRIGGQVAGVAKKPCHRKGLRIPHTLAHDATEVTHGVASPASRKFTPVPGKNRKMARISCQSGLRRVGELASDSFCDRSGEFRAPREAAAGRAFL
jgi:hypothetical protein